MPARMMTLGPEPLCRQAGLGDKWELLLAESLRVAPRPARLRGQDSRGHGRHHGAAEAIHLSTDAKCACGHQGAKTAWREGTAVRRGNPILARPRPRDDGGACYASQTFSGISAVACLCEPVGQGSSAESQQIEGSQHGQA